MKMKFLGGCLLMVLTTGVVAGQGDRDIGLRAGILLGPGEPSNDLFGYGVYGTYGLNDHWKIGLAIDQYAFDYERPSSVVRLNRLATDAEIDSDATSNVFSVWLQNDRFLARKWTWYWGVGLGYSDYDADDVTGIADGSPYLITTDAGNEVIALAMIGASYQINEKWNVDITGRIQQHFGEWESIDRISGMRGTIDDYSTQGIDVGLKYKF